MPTVADVRLKVRDSVDPYVYSDAEVAAAIADAGDLVDAENISPTCPKRDTLQKLIAARLLIEAGNATRPSAPSPISQVTSGEKSVAYAIHANDTTAYLQGIYADIDKYLNYCRRGGANRSPGYIGVLRDNF